MQIDRPRRSALYMPASNARAIEKARQLDCDVVILDLEDAVAPEGKEAAREQALAAARVGGFGHRELVLRVNGLGTPWGADDLGPAREAGFDAVLVPKVSSPEDLAACRRELGPGIRLWAMIETCAAILELSALSGACAETGCDAWIMGSNDLAKEMRCELGGDRHALWTPLSLAVIAARRHGLAILDGVYNDIEDDAGLRAQCLAGLALGFEGKTLIHPRQVEIANNAFGPAEQDVAWARRVVQAFAEPENAGKGVLKVEGRMVERLHLEQAEQLIGLADAIQSRAQAA